MMCPNVWKEILKEVIENYFLGEFKKVLPGIRVIWTRPFVTGSFRLKKTFMPNFKMAKLFSNVKRVML